MPYHKLPHTAGSGYISPYAGKQKVDPDIDLLERAQRGEAVSIEDDEGDDAPGKPTLPPPPPGVIRSDEARKAHQAMVRSTILPYFEQHPGEVVDTSRLAEYFGLEANGANTRRIGLLLSNMERDGYLVKEGYNTSTRKNGWKLAKNGKRIPAMADTDTDMVLADLASKLKLQRPENSERIIAELRVVADQLEALGVNNVVISDFRRLADWLEGLRDG